MRELRLSLDALRTGGLPAVHGVSRASEAVKSALSAKPISRRGFMGAGAAVLGASAAPSVTRGTAPGRFDVVGDSKRLAFVMNGRERWVIDTALFAGNPVLRLQRARNRIALTLRNARFPGTRLPADFMAEIAPAFAGWTLQLRLAAGAFHGEAAFERWLMGEIPIRSWIQQVTQLCQLPQGAVLSVVARAKAEFLPNWVLRLHGSRAAILSDLASSPVYSNRVSVTLLPAGEPSIFAAAERRRTLLALERDDHSWDLHRVLRPVGGRFAAASAAFDRIAIEAGEVQHGLRADALNDECHLTFHPAEHVLGDDGRVLGLPLRKARFALTWDAQGEQSALVAELPKDPLWLHANGCALEVGSGAGGTAFEWAHVNGELNRLSCAPTLLRTAVPMRGAVVGLAPAPAGSRLALVFDGNRADTPTGTSYLSLQPPPRGPGGVGLNDPKFSVLRPDDLLALDFQCTNLTLLGGANPQLVRTNPGSAAYITVIFPPQNIAEQAFYDDAGSNIQPQGPDPDAGHPGEPLPAPPVQARISGPSQLVFQLPAGTNQIPYTLESLLSWSQWDVSAPLVAPAPIRILGQMPATSADNAAATQALAAQSVGTASPDAPPTSIEAPYRLMISPSALGAWANATAAVQSNGWTELWHTRLGVKAAGALPPDESSAYQRIVRAIGSPDSVPPLPQGHYDRSNPRATDSQPFRTSLDRMDRYELVRLTSDFNTPGLTPAPVQVNRLMLSSLGAWLDLEGDWSNTPTSLDVTGWKHRSTMGRDHYVRVVYRGYLYPSGHAASLVKVTERKFQRRSAKDPVGAYLRQRFYITVRQATKSYPVAGQPNLGRELPFRTLQVTTLNSPDLDDPTTGPSVISTAHPLGQDAFWPCVQGQPFPFHLIAEDLEGKRCDFSIPLIFVSSNLAYGDCNNASDPLKFIADAYNLESPSGGPSRRWTEVPGAKVAYAPSDKPGDTSFLTTGLSLGAGCIAGSQQLDQPSFYPTLAQAEVNIPAIAQLLQPGAAGTTNITLDPDYLAAGFPPANATGHPNAPSIYLRLTQAVPMDFSGSGDKSGGVVSPSLNIMGLSRTLGTVGGDPTLTGANQKPFADLQQGNFNPQSIFAGMSSAKLLGTIPLTDIIPLTPIDLSKGPDAKALTIKTTPVLTHPQAPPTAIDTTIDWSPKLQDSGVFLASYPVSSTPNATLRVQATLHKDFTGSPATTSITGLLNNFTLSIFDSINVGFSSFKFTSNSGEKMTLEPTVGAVSFMGAMSFVNALQSMLSQAGSNWGGLTIDVQPSGLTVKDTVSLPDIAVGIMSLQNLAFSAELDLPFTGEAVTMTFMFCSKQKPFVMSYCAFAGGGFFAITVALDGLRSVEISLWFGGSLAINLGVASGGVHIMAGIDLTIGTDPTTQKQIISAGAFIQLGGALNVLGLITISIEFDLSLYYYSQYQQLTDVLVGQCTLTVQIDISVFSKSVDLTVERILTSSGGASNGQRAVLQTARATALAPPQPPTFTQMMDEHTWETGYWAAFAA